MAAAKSPEKSRLKLFKILRTFSASQMTSFYKFLNSPFFHNTDEVVRLFRFYRKQHPEYFIEKVNDEMVAKRLFPLAEHGPKKIKNFRTDLLKLIEKFLIINELERDPVQSKWLLSQAYHQQGLPGFFNKQLLAIEKLIHQKPKDLHYFQNKVNLSHTRYFHPDIPKFLQSGHLLKELLENLDEYYLSAKIKYAYEVRERMDKLKEVYVIKLLNEAQNQILTKELMQENPIVRIYRLLLELQQSPPDQLRFLAIKNIYFEILPELSNADGQAIFKYLINYTIKAIAAGQLRFVDVQFELYKLGLEKGLCLHNGRLTETTFINIAILAAHLKYYSWLDNFIADHKKFLNPEHRTTLVYSAKAYAYFNKGEFNKTAELIAKIERPITIMKLTTLSLEVKTFFELAITNDSYLELLNAKIRALNRFVSKENGLSPKKEMTYKNYLKFLKLIINFHFGIGMDKTELGQLKKDIEASSEVVQKPWLMEKINQLFKKREGPKPLP
ncbi:MAG: hypothetical protein AAFZ15_13200 [Bacteroidota bacterium]